MKMLRNCYIIFIYLIFIVLSAKVSYAQSLNFTPPVKLNDSVNSSAEEDKPILSPDGTTLYFVRDSSSENTGGITAGMDIWYCRKTKDGEWTKARNDLKLINNGDNNTLIGINNSGKRIFLVNAYAQPIVRYRSLASSDNKKGKWSFPKEIDLPFRITSGFHELYILPSEDVLLISMGGDDSFGEEDLYVSIKDAAGNWGKVINLGKDINTPGFEISPFCTANRDTLFFASNGHGGYGNADIFMTVRQDSTWQHWSKPVNLGEGVNSKAFDAYFYLAANGEAFFSSNREGELADIYTTTLTHPQVSNERMVAIADSITKARARDSVLRIVHQQEIRRTDSMTRAQLANTLSHFVLYFKVDSFNLMSDQENRLDSLTRMLRKINDVRIKITGYTDATGSETHNLELSMKRAVAVSDYLISRGIPGSRVKAEGKSDANPVADNSTEKGRSQNRRAVITADMPDE